MMAPTAAKTSTAMRFDRARGRIRTATAPIGGTVKQLVVRYKTKPDRAEENQKLVEAVFAELHDRSPDGFGYTTLRLDDGVSFIHIVVERTEGSIALNDIAAFREFVADVDDRCVEKPVATAATIVGSYNL